MRALRSQFMYSNRHSITLLFQQQRYNSLEPSLARCLRGFVQSLRLSDGDQLESILASAASLPEIPWSGGEQAEVKSLNESPCDSRRSQLFTGGRRPAEDVFGVRAVLQVNTCSYVRSRSFGGCRC